MVIQVPDTTIADAEAETRKIEESILHASRGRIKLPLSRCAPGRGVLPANASPFELTRGVGPHRPQGAGVRNVAAQPGCDPDRLLDELAKARDLDYSVDLQAPRTALPYPRAICRCSTTGPTATAGR
jgi:hypothetical protein